MTGALVQKRDDLAVDLIDLLTLLLNVGEIAVVCRQRFSLRVPKRGASLAAPP